MKVSDFFPTKYLGAADLQGKSWRLSIAVLRVEEVGLARDKKPVLYFAQGKKGLVLNATNAETIASIAGSEEVDSWKNVTIEVYPTTTEFRGATVPCIRVRAPKTPSASVRSYPSRPAPAPAPLEDELAAPPDPEGDNPYGAEGEVPF